MTTIQPTLETERLILRPLALEDAQAVQRLADCREIADTTISILHPFSEEQARDWITAQTAAFSKGKGVCFASELKQEMRMIGAVGLREIDAEHSQGEMGFWLGAQSARAVIGYGFERLGLNRICAHHMVRNPASGRVLEKIGMRREGVLRQRVRKWGVFEAVVILAILHVDWVQLGAS